MIKRQREPQKRKILTKVPTVWKVKKEEKLVKSLVKTY